MLANLEAYLLDLSVVRQRIRITPNWSSIDNIDIVRSDGAFELELAWENRSVFLAMTNVAVVGHALIVVKGKR